MPSPSNTISCLFDLTPLTSAQLSTDFQEHVPFFHSISSTHILRMALDIVTHSRMVTLTLIFLIYQEERKQSQNILAVEEMAKKIHLWKTSLILSGQQLHFQRAQT